MNLAVAEEIMANKNESAVIVTSTSSLSSSGNDKTQAKRAVIGCARGNMNLEFSSEAFDKAIHPEKIGNMIGEPSSSSSSSSDEIYTSVIKSDPVYICYKTIESCPVCNINLDPEQFTVNVVKMVMKTRCRCGLSIEIMIRQTCLNVDDDDQKKRKRIKSDNNYNNKLAMRRLRPRINYNLK